MTRFKNHKVRYQAVPLVGHASAIAEPLTFIYNLSLKLGKIPLEWKNAIVTPIFKNKGSKHDPSNYRPISLTCIACRIMESIIRDSMMKYLRTNVLLSDMQYGFIGGRSTVLQLLHVLDKWTEVLDTGGYVDVIFCDFQKAFDTVPHNRLLELLRHYGITDPVLAWIEDFLRNRNQSVSVNGCKSKYFRVTSGVPQGSVLGPLLFIIFINSLIEKINSPEMLLYADDVKIFKAISSHECTELLQQHLDKMYDWTCYSLLRFHPDKCVTMRLSASKRNNPEIFNRGRYNLDNVQLKDVDNVKDLGVYFNDSLSFDDHIHIKSKKANSLVGMIRRTFTYLDQHMFKQLFTSVIRPHLEYGGPVWNPHLKKHIQTIENVQRRASKMIPGLSHLRYKERLKKINLPTLVYRRYRGDMIEAFKITHGFYDKEVCGDILKIRNRSETERESRSHQYTIQRDKCNKDLRKYFFRNRIANQWNNLPIDIVNASTLNTFKKRLDKIWTRDDIMFDSEIDLYQVTSERKTRYLRHEDIR